MDSWVVALVGVVVVTAGVAVALAPRLRRWLRRRRRAARIRTLRARYLRMLNEPPRMARETLGRQLEGLAETHPGKKPEWYLEKLIADLERARR